MQKLVTVKTLVPHGNSFGEAHAKKKGDSYECDADTAKALERDSLVERDKGDAPAGDLPTGIVAS